MRPKRKNATAVLNARDDRTSTIRERYASHDDPEDPRNGSRRATPGVDGREPSREDGLHGVPFAISSRGEYYSIGTLLSGLFTKFTSPKSKYMCDGSTNFGLRFPSLEPHV
jgi:hypothetical protein